MSRMLLEKINVALIFTASIFFNPSSHSSEAEPLAKNENAPLKKIVWAELAKTDQLPEATSIDDDEENGVVLKVVRSKDMPQLVELAKIENPEMSKRAYLLQGKVKFVGVEGDGFLETWTHFPEPKEGAFFSRTMAETGPTGRLRGDSTWRNFALPFTFDDSEIPFPSKIQFNVFLPNENAIVWITDLELIEVDPKDMTKQLSSGLAFFNLSWSIFLIGLLTIVGIALGIGAATWAFLRSRQLHDIETRRMQALDIT